MDLPQRIVMHVDLDYFFAQCEERRDPSLKTKPLVVCVYSGRSAESGAVSTTNYLARQYGVKSGIPIMTAKRILKDTDAVFLPVDQQFYGQVSGRIMEIVRGFGDAFERGGIDEAFIEVGDKAQGDFGRAKALATEIKNAIRSKEGLTCSIGIGPNKLIAKIASDYQKPDGLTVVAPAEVKEFQSPLPVGKLIGIGKKTEERLHREGISTVGELAKFDVEKLCQMFGRNLGRYFHNAANGVDNEPLEATEERDQISRMVTLKENTRDPSNIIPVINELAGEVKSKVEEEGLTFRSVGVIAIMEDLSTHTRSRTLPSYTRDLEGLKGVAGELLQHLIRETDLEIRRIGVRVSAFQKATGQKALSDYLAD